MCLMLYALHSRIIKYIILNKGGKTLTLVTHHFLKKKSTINLSVESVKMEINSYLILNNI